MSEEVRPGYKRTEVGVIPEDWEIASFDTLGSVIDGDRGVNYPGSRDFSNDGDCMFLNAGNVTKSGFRFSECAFISREKDEQLSKGKLRRHDIVLTTRGTVGNFAYFDIEVPFEQMRINSGMVILRNQSPELNTQFLYNLLQSRYTEMQIERLTFGSAQPQLTVKGISKFSILAPPLPEQRAIAEALGDVDALLSALDRLIAKKRDLKQAAMQQLLTGQTRLPGFHDEWEEGQIGSAIDLLTGYPFPSAEYFNSGVKLCRGSNIKRGVTDWSDGLVQYWPKVTSDIIQYVLKEGDIVIAMDGSLVGRSFARVSNADLPALLLQRVARIRSQQIDMGYLKEWICSEFFTKHCDANKTVTAIPHISPSDIRSFPIQIPPTLEEQVAIAAVLSDMDAELAALEARRDKTQALKQGMMQELLTGKTRLLAPGGTNA